MSMGVNLISTFKEWESNSLLQILRVLKYWNHGFNTLWQAKVLHQSAKVANKAVIFNTLTYNLRVCDCFPHLDSQLLVFCRLDWNKGRKKLREECVRKNCFLLCLVTSRSSYSEVKIKLVEDTAKDFFVRLFTMILMIFNNLCKYKDVTVCAAWSISRIFF